MSALTCPPCRVLICGSRDATTKCQEAVWGFVAGLQADDVVITGDAYGPDDFAWRAAGHYGLKSMRYAADWKAHGRGAGPRRNQRMLDEGKPTRVVAFWNGSSRGTADMIRRARKAGIPVEIRKI